MGKGVLWGVALLSSMTASEILAATAISTVNTTTTLGTPSSYNNLTNTETYNYGVGTNLIITGFEIGASVYDPIATANSMTINRNTAPTASVPASRTVLWYNEANTTNDGDATIDLAADYAATMEEALLGPNIGRGTDNIFSNQGDGAGTAGNNNNIERADYIVNAGLQAQNAAQLQAGILLMERGGNDNIGIAAITALDSNGNPISYGNVVLVGVSNGEWGSSGIQVNTPVLNSGEVDSPSFNEPTMSNADVDGQFLNGTFISFADLGLAVGQTMYGYSLFGVDTYNLVFASGNSNNLVDYLNTTYFPQTTSNEGTTGGGLDLVAGGVFFAEESLDLEGFALPEPASAVAAAMTFAGAMTVFGRRRARMMRASA